MRSGDGTVSDASPLLRTEELEVGWSRHALLPPANVTFEKGCFWAVIGPNGSGKSTFVRTLLGLQPPVAGRRIAKPGLRVSFMPQRADVHSRVPARAIDVVRGGVDRHLSFLNPLYRRRVRSDVDRAIESTQIGEFKHQQYRTLSDGQQQRVLLARALASNPDVLVMDEPTSAMDVNAEREVLRIIRHVVDDSGALVIMISHHLPVIAEFATHGLLLDRVHSYVIAGPLAEVSETPECRHLFGSALDTHRHTGGHSAIAGCHE